MFYKAVLSMYLKLIAEREENCPGGNRQKGTLHKQVTLQKKLNAVAQLNLRPKKLP